MNPQDLKQGQSYLILANYYGNDCDNDHHFIAVPSKSRFYLDERAVQTCVSLPSEPPTLAGAYPKYDPYREFQEGDKVKLKTHFGRKPFDSFLGKEYTPDGTVFTVLREEWNTGNVDIFYKDASDAFSVHFSNLELITPIEELEPYEVTESTDYFAVSHRVTGDAVSTFWKEWHPNPKEAAEAERDRLNAEHRKEQA